MMLSTYLLLPLLTGLATSAVLEPRNFTEIVNNLKPGGNPRPLAISREGPEIWGSFNEIDEAEMEEAIECLHEQICNKRNVPHKGKIRCVIGTSVAYMCNYRPKTTEKWRKLFEKLAGVSPGSTSCHQLEMYEAWREIRIATDSQTGWWYDKWGFRTYGFDKWCPEGECDNGWKIENPGEQCSNIHVKRWAWETKEQPPWTFDYKAEDYANYTGKYEQELPSVGGKGVGGQGHPIYFAPWVVGRRPQSD
ncbi:hypothetical protein V8F20_011522 [Naviculisporaceae sp. PSN 640]